MAEQNMTLEFDAGPLREVLAEFQAVVADAAALGRIADALEKLANPPETITADFLEAKPDTRAVEALERIADALELQNGASLAQVAMDPASPGALRLVQAVTDIIVQRLQDLNRRHKRAIG